MAIERELPEYRLAEVSRSLRADDHAAARAREMIRGAFADRLDPDKVDDLELLVSELVTNSVRHGELPPGSMIHIRSYIHDKRVRVEIRDSSSPKNLAPLPLNGPREHGYGLFMVEQVSNRWGISLNGHTQFWFELDL